MSTLVATLRLDIQLQARHKLYPIGLVIAVGMGLAAHCALDEATLRLLLPVFYLGALASTTYMFIASLVMLEKGERIIEALRVSPLSPRTYVASKVATLTAFALVESLIVLFMSLGLSGYRPLPLLAGVVALGAMYGLVGLAQATRRTTVTDFIIPDAAVAQAALQTTPLLVALGAIDEHPLLLLVPSQAPMELLRAAFGPAETWRLVYGVAYSLLWVVIFYRVCRGQLRRHLYFDDAGGA